MGTDIDTSVYLVLSLTDAGDIWEHRTFIPALGDANPMGVDGQRIMVRDVDLGVYKVVEFVSVREVHRAMGHDDIISRVELLGKIGELK